MVSVQKPAKSFTIRNLNYYSFTTYTPAYLQYSFSCFQRMGLKGRNEILNCSTTMDWLQVMKMKGLIVEDIYTKWAGPCDIMMPIVMKTKTQIQESFFSTFL